MAQEFFITATGTNIGKTFILQKLCQKFSDNNQRFSAIKPIISGFEYDDLNNDTVKILQALQQDINQENLNKISPWRFQAPLSPNIAADLEGKKINFADIIDFCQKKITSARKNKEHLLIEGAGGIMTPINDNKTFCDLIYELNIPIILVIGNYLGTISHSLTAIKVIQYHQIAIEKIVLNCKNNDTINPKDTLRALEKFTDAKIVTEIGMS